MNDLTPRERELVALGAAMGSNCVPCVQYHIAESRRIGLADPAIHAAIRHADKIRQVPARKTLDAALKLLSATDEAVQDAAAAEGCGCGEPTETAKGEPSQTAQPRDTMMQMMSNMMDACGSPSDSAPNRVESKLAASPAAGGDCGCN
ncbi:MAG: carboxymuconolactone decarboxylase family protein [Chloroflexi bacterium]|nr:carboxymuconolactone decarboxylase family protein [Chloroflexota bacterium]